MWLAGLLVAALPSVVLAQGQIAVVNLDKETVARLDPAAQTQLRNEMEQGRLSGRGYHRVRRVARTIADLRGDETDSVGEADIVLALRFRATLAAALRTGRAA